MLHVVNISRTLMVMSVAAFAAAAAFSGIPEAQAEEQSAYAEGARLYDKWFKVIKVETPKTSHPAYPSDKKYAKKASANWRCKECHGWDGLGVSGAYASGKHNTGIKGIDGMKGSDPAKVVAVLSDKTH